MVGPQIADYAVDRIPVKVRSRPSEHVLTINNYRRIRVEVLASDVQNDPAAVVNGRFANVRSIRSRGAVVRWEESDRDVLINHEARTSSSLSRAPIQLELAAGRTILAVDHDVIGVQRVVDRKSTRLNSSHIP